jgi:TetR/AcrR family transcriptional regulator, transcriptional repressor for nem operon
MSSTREYIIDQAYKLFLSRSYEAVSINEISKAIGFTKGALYHHFLNKEELFKAVIDKYLSISEMEADFDHISLARLIEVCIKSIEVSLKNITNSVPSFITVNHMALVIDALRHYPEFASNKTNLFITEIDKIKRVLNNAIKTGEIRNDIDTSVMAANFFSINMGLVGNLFHSNSPELALNSLKTQLNELYKVIKT